MLRLTAENGHLEYSNGFAAAPQTVTRYAGERWEEVTSDLLCSVADTFKDVGIIFAGNSSQLLDRLSQANLKASVEREYTTSGWLPINADNQLKSVYSFSEKRAWLFVPNSREAVEEVVSWTFWEEDFRATAFTGYRELRDRLLSTKWNVESGDLEAFVAQACTAVALFQMTWGPGTWRLFPGSIELGSLTRLADPVVARINTELTD